MDCTNTISRAPGQEEPAARYLLSHQGNSAGQLNCEAKTSKLCICLTDIQEAHSIPDAEPALVTAKLAQGASGVVACGTIPPREPLHAAAPAARRLGAPLKPISVMCSPPLSEHLTTKRLREMDRVRPGCMDTKRSKRASEGHSPIADTHDEGSDAGEQTEHGDAAAAGTPRRGTIYGIFHPDRYLNAEDCIDYQGNFITRSKFEKLGGSLMAKWYRSIRVVTTDEPLGTWLTRRGLPVLKGTSRNRKPLVADVSIGTTDKDQDHGKAVTRGTGPRTTGGCCGDSIKDAGGHSGRGGPVRGPGKRDIAFTAVDAASGGGRDAKTPSVPAGSGCGTVKGCAAVPAISQAGSGHGCAFTSRGGADGETTTATATSGRSAGGDAAALQLRQAIGTKTYSAGPATAGGGAGACSGSLVPPPAAVTAPPARAADPYMQMRGSPARLPVLGGPNLASDDSRMPPYNAILRGPQRFSPSCSSQVSSEEPLQASFLSYATAPEAATAANIVTNASVASGLELHLQAAAPLPARLLPASGSGLLVERPCAEDCGGGISGTGHDSGTSDSMRSVVSVLAQPPLLPAAAAFCSVSGDQRRPGQSFLGSSGGSSAPPAPPPGPYASSEQADAAWLYWAWSGYGDLEAVGQVGSAAGTAATPPPPPALQPVVASDPRRLAYPTAQDAAAEPLHIRKDVTGAGGSQQPCARSCGGGSVGIDTAAVASSWPSLLQAPSSEMRLPSSGPSYGGGTDGCGYGGVRTITSTTTTITSNDGGGSGGSFIGDGGRRSCMHYEHHAPQGSEWAAPRLGSRGPSELPPPPTSQTLNRIEMVKQELMRGAHGGGSGTGAAAEVLRNFGTPRGPPPQPPPSSHQLLQPPLLQPRSVTSNSFEARVKRLMQGGNSSSGDGGGGSIMRLGCLGPRMAAAAALSGGGASAGGAALLNSAISGSGDGRIWMEPIAAAATAASDLAGRVVHRQPTACVGQQQQGGLNASQWLPAGGQQTLRLQDCGGAAGGTAVLGWWGPLGAGPPFPANPEAASWGL